MANDGMADMIGELTLNAARAGVERCKDKYGEPAEHMHRVLDGVDAVLEHAGVYQGKRITLQIIAAMDLAKLAMGLVASRDPAHVLAEALTCIAVLAHALAIDVGQAPAKEPEKAPEPEEGQAARHEIERQIGAGPGDADLGDTAHATDLDEPRAAA